MGGSVDVLILRQDHLLHVNTHNPVRDILVVNMCVYDIPIACAILHEPPWNPLGYMNLPTLMDPLGKSWGNSLF